MYANSQSSDMHQFWRGVARITPAFRGKQHDREHRLVPDNVECARA